MTTVCRGQCQNLTHFYCCDSSAWFIVMFYLCFELLHLWLSFCCCIHSSILSFIFRKHFVQGCDASIICARITDWDGNSLQDTIHIHIHTRFHVTSIHGLHFFFFFGRENLEDTHADMEIHVQTVGSPSSQSNQEPWSYALKKHHAFQGDFQVSPTVEEDRLFFFSLSSQREFFLRLV